MESIKKRSDTTSAKRQTEHLRRLKDVHGRRLPVDLDAERNKKLQKLVEAGYGSSMADVIRRAIDAAYDQAVSKTEPNETLDHEK